MKTDTTNVTEGLPVFELSDLFDSYKIGKSVFNVRQQELFGLELDHAITLLIDLCLSQPFAIKKIVYLAEDILEVASSIPSALNNKKFIDMNCEVCPTIRKISTYAAKVQTGIEVDISDEISTIRHKYG